MNKPENVSADSLIAVPQPRHVAELVLYPAWSLAYKRTLAVAQLAPAGVVAFVIGAGGAGKTSMFHALGADVYGDPQMWAIGSLPVVKVSAENPDHAFFSSKSLMIDLLTAVMDPFRATGETIEAWGLDESLKARLRTAVARLRGVRSSEPDLRRAFISIAKAVGVKLILIDEANLMCLTQQNRVPTDYLESLRTLAQAVGCRVILFGTVDLLGMIDYSAQLNRRNPRILIERMYFKSKEQRDEFKGFLHCLESELKLSPGLLVRHAEEIHSYTYGIPGEVVGLVQRADEERLAREATEISWEHLLSSAPLPDVIKRMREEADLITLVMSGMQKSASSKDQPVTERKRPSFRRRPVRYAVPARTDSPDSK
jgi:GTPase SAR1 family protein